MEELTYKKIAQGIYHIHGMSVAGDIVKFGAMTGNTAVAFVAAINQERYILVRKDKVHGYANRRLLYLFDLFDGLPITLCDEDKISLYVVFGLWGRGTCKGLSPNELHRLCSKYLDAKRICIV